MTPQENFDVDPTTVRDAILQSLANGAKCVRLQLLAPDGGATWYLYPGNAARVDLAVAEWACMMGLTPPKPIAPRAESLAPVFEERSRRISIGDLAKDALSAPKV